MALSIILREADRPVNIGYPKFMKHIMTGETVLAFQTQTGAIAGVRLSDNAFITLLPVDNYKDFNLPITIQNKA